MKDFLLNNTGDLKTVDGDFACGYSDLQQQEHILVAQKGSFKENPNRGVGIEDFLNESEIEEMLSMIVVEFERDKMKVAKIDYNEAQGELNYDAKY